MTENEIRKVLSRNLKDFRAKRRLSQMALAEKAEVASNFINDIENCKKWVSPATLAKLCDALNIKAYQLLLPVRTDFQYESQAIQTFSEEVINTVVDSIHRIAASYQG